MPSLLQTLLLLALITFALAAPNPNILQKRTFKIERVPNPNFKRAANHVRSVGAGTRALVRAHRKYSVPLPAGLLEALGATAGGASSTGIQQVDGDGLGALLGGLDGGDSGAGAGAGGENEGAGHGAGHGDGAGGGNEGAGRGKGGGGGEGGGETMSAVQPAATAIPTTPAADNSTAPAAATNGTGSAFGSVAATPEPGDVEYLSPVNIGGQTITLDFDSGSSDLWVFNSQLPAASTTNHMVFDITKSTTFKMMDGASYSVSYGDGSGSAGNVGTDTVNIGGVTVTSQAVELPTAVSASFVQDTASNGLLGLAFSKLNTVKPTQQKTFFDNAIPTLQTPVFTADLRHAVPGAYEFGTIDSTKFNGTMQWAPINTTNGFWQFSSQSASLGAAGAVQLPGGQAIADTGTTLMLMDPSIVNAYYSQVTGAANDAQAGGVTFPCSATLPDMAVDIGGQFMATVRGSDINFAPVDQSGTTCFGGLQSISSSLQIYGDIMFKSNFVAFNAGNNSIGMAPHL